MTGASKEGTALPVASIAVATGGEIDRLADILLDVERDVLTQIAEGTDHPGSTREAQQLDLVLQSLRALAALMHQVAEVLPPDVTLDRETAIPVLTLERLRHRILGGDDEAPKGDGRTIEMF